MNSIFTNFIKKDNNNLILLLLFIIFIEHMWGYLKWNLRDELESLGLKTTIDLHSHETELACAI